jgi:hypothetical protein
MRQLLIDFEESAAPALGDERVLGRAIASALGEPRRRFHGHLVGRAAAAVLLVAGVASGAILLGNRDRVQSAPSAEPAPSHRPKALTEVSVSVASPAALPTPPDLPTVAAVPTPTGPTGVPARPTGISRSTSSPRRGNVRSTVYPDAVDIAVSPQTTALDSEESAAQAAPVIETPPSIEDAATLFARAVSQRDLGQTSSAMTTFRSLQRRFPRSRQAVLSWVSLADLSLGAGDVSGALASFDAYLVAAPSGILVPEALLGKARALEVLGKARQADAVWQELARRYPDTPYGERRMGTLKEGRNR